MPATREKFGVIFTFLADQDPADVPPDAEEWLADAKLARAGGQRDSEWTWTLETEDPWAFESRMAELRERIGQPWDPDDPDDLITVEAIDELQAKGPRHYRLGSCWSVRA